VAAFNMGIVWFEGGHEGAQTYVDIVTALVNDFKAAGATVNGCLVTYGVNHQDPDLPDPNPPGLFWHVWLGGEYPGDGTGAELKPATDKAIAALSALTTADITGLELVWDAGTKVIGEYDSTGSITL